jgi:Pyruvate/2-oxoacid:ferredoxin oxidoreductase delta subunit
MKTLTRKIIQIDEEKCNGCGACIPNCREGALAIINGKAKLVSEKYCDGLGACLGHCPQDAIRIVERPAEAFDESAVEVHLKAAAPAVAAHGHAHAGCPSARAISMTERLKEKNTEGRTGAGAGPAVSRLGNWPLELSLVPVNAPYLNGADLLIAADCVGFSLPDFHERLLRGKVLIIACPKLDDTSLYKEKLAQMFKVNDLKSVTVAHMEVPCCFGLKMLVEDALEASGKDIPLHETVVSIEGSMKE